MKTAKKTIKESKGPKKIRMDEKTGSGEKMAEGER